MATIEREELEIDCLIAELAADPAAARVRWTVALQEFRANLAVAERCAGAIHPDALSEARQAILVAQMNLLILDGLKSGEITKGSGEGAAWQCSPGVVARGLALKNPGGTTP